MSDKPRLAPTTSVLAAPASAREEAVQLARRAAGGDAVATRALLESVAPRVVRTARIVLGAGHPEVEDAVQLALIGFIQSLPGFRGECAPSSGLTPLARVSGLTPCTPVSKGREAVGASEVTASSSCFALSSAIMYGP